MMGQPAISQAVPREARGAATRERGGYDPWLAGAALGLALFGLVMVASASVSVAERLYHDPFYFCLRQGVALTLGLLAATVVLQLPMRLWEQASGLCLLFAFFLLVLVLLPGLGHEVNGSMRWLRLGPFSLQASEPVKLAMVIYLAGYLVRHRDSVRTGFTGFIKPIGVTTVIGGLLLLEPDYGTTVVLMATCLGMMFTGGVPVSRFFSWSLVAVALLATLAVTAPYRLKRLMVFMDPWSDPFNSGFQLVQALIAFGRGEWFGVGLGNSVQKLFYLPEAHTDFIFAISAEEFGLVGVLLLIGVYLFIVWRAIQIGGLSEQAGRPFAAFVAYGIGLMLGLQAFINMGVNMALLPTKGLTLPLLSYGSNSVVVTSVAIALLLRIGYEARAELARPRSGEVDHVV